MLGKLTHVTVWVDDQDEALAFYTKRLGMEVREDVTVAEMGDYRWLTVGPTSQPDVSFILTVPGPPVIDGELAKQLRDFIAKGVIGSYHFATDDCQATYLELKEQRRRVHHGTHRDAIPACSPGTARPTVLTDAPSSRAMATFRSWVPGCSRR